MESTPPANPRPAEGAPTHTLRVVRGGVGIGAVVTGALVVSAAAALLTSLAIAVSSYVGYKPYRLPLGGTRQVGLTVAVGVGLGLLVAFMWGGYAAGVPVMQRPKLGTEYHYCKLLRSGAGAGLMQNPAGCCALCVPHAPPTVRPPGPPGHLGGGVRLLGCVTHGLGRPHRILKPGELRL